MVYFSSRNYNGSRTYDRASAVCFLHNVMRELFAIVLIPFVAKKIGYVETVGLPGFCRHGRMFAYSGESHEERYRRIFLHIRSDPKHISADSGACNHRIIITDAGREGGI